MSFNLCRMLLNRNVCWKSVTLTSYYNILTKPRNLHPACSVLRCRISSKTNQQIKTPIKQELMDKPIDDVYLESLYVPVKRDLKSAISLLKEYTKVDQISQDSVIILKLELDPQGKRKKEQLNMFTTIELPHQFGHENKIGVFTSEEEFVDIALKNNAYAAGGSDFIMKLMTGRVICDAYLATKDMEKQLKLDTSLASLIGKLMPNPRRGEITNEFLPILETYRKNTICNNASNKEESKIVIASLNQPNEEIQENIEFAIKTINSFKRVGTAFIKKPYISSFTEYIPFEFEIDTEEELTEEN